MARSNSTKVAINGFGRIGRLVLRTLLERCKTELAVVAINDMADLKTNAHLFRYDSTYGIYPGKVECTDGAMNVDGQTIAVLNQKDPARLPWKQLGRRDRHRSHRGIYRRRPSARPSGRRR